MTRRHRVLLCVEAVDGRTVSVRIPSWNPDKIASMALDAFPEGLRPLVTAESHFIAMVRLDASVAADLDPREFEYVPSPESGDTI